MIIDSEQEEGKELVYGCQVSMHNGKVMVSVGGNTSGCQSTHLLTRPLSCGNLCRVFDKLIDANGSLVDDSIYYGDEYLLVHQ